jgi:hypothetical protein
VKAVHWLTQQASVVEIRSHLAEQTFSPIAEKAQIPATSELDVIAAALSDVVIP